MIHLAFMIARSSKRVNEPEQGSMTARETGMWENESERASEKDEKEISFIHV